MTTRGRKLDKRKNAFSVEVCFPFHPLMSLSPHREGAFVELQHTFSRHASKVALYIAS